MVQGKTILIRRDSGHSVVDLVKFIAAVHSSIVELACPSQAHDKDVEISVRSDSVNSEGAEIRSSDLVRSSVHDADLAQHLSNLELLFMARFQSLGYPSKPKGATMQAYAGHCSKFSW